MNAPESAKDQIPPVPPLQRGGPYSLTFDRIVQLVIAKSPLQKKKLEQYLSGMDELFFQRAEEFARDYAGYLESQQMPLDYAIDSYLGMCKTMMKCQIEFMKTGSYASSSQHDAFDAIYSSTEKMKPYMIGLALSQFLWKSHYLIFDHFQKAISEEGPKCRSYLEVGPGHGLYLRQALRYLPENAELHAVDISPVSIEITKSIISHFVGDLPNLSFWTRDFLEFESSSRFDFITMGEVLEHVNRPELFLKRIALLLSDNGRAFVTTSINSPAVDHVYHYHHVDEVREMFSACGLAIVEERILPVEELPMAEIVARKITVNYSAELRRMHE